MLPQEAASGFPITDSDGRYPIYMKFVVGSKRTLPVNLTICELQADFIKVILGNQIIDH